MKQPVRALERKARSLINDDACFIDRSLNKVIRLSCYPALLRLFRLSCSPWLVRPLKHVEPFPGSILSLIKAAHDLAVPGPRGESLRDTVQQLHCGWADAGVTAE